MFANGPRMTLSLYKIRLAVFGLLCLLAILCIVKTFHLMLNHNHALTLILTNETIKRHQTNNMDKHNPAGYKDSLHKDLIDMNDHLNMNMNSGKLNNQEHKIRIRRDTSHWSPLPFSLAPLMVELAKIESAKKRNQTQNLSINNKQVILNQRSTIDKLPNVHSSIASVVGAKSDSQLSLARNDVNLIKKPTSNSNNNNININNLGRLATGNDNLRPINGVRSMETLKPQTTNLHFQTKSGEKSIDNNSNNIRQNSKQHQSSRSNSTASSPNLSAKGKFITVANISSIINALSKSATPLRRNCGKDNQADKAITSRSSSGQSRSSVPLIANNYDNNQWKPIPDDYNGPLLPVQVDVVDAFYDANDYNKYSQKGRNHKNNKGFYNQISDFKKGKHHYSETPPLEMQQPTLTHKIYKRVLLCDKTLVSLDFAQNILSEPRPHSSDNNLIDFEALNIINSDNNVARVRSSSQNRSSLLDNHNSHNEMKAINRNHINSVLSEGDPLVACDMWDLEKGLSSRKPPRETVRQAVRIDFPTIRDAINKCRALGERTLPPVETDQSMELSPDDIASIFSVKRGLMPGTKWCGIGDSAASYNDLGTRKKIDICCRAHDHCPIRLKPFRQGYGILNLAIYTKSHCDCDEDFYRCLKSTRTKVADLLGNIYFNVLKLQCMHEEKLKICKSMKKVALGFEKCVKWEESPDKKVFRFIHAPVAY